MCKPNKNKNADPDKDKYSSYGIGSDSHSEFSLTDRSMRKNVITFEADVSSSVHIEIHRRICTIFRINEVCLVW